MREQEGDIGDETIKHVYVGWRERADMRSKKTYQCGGAGSGLPCSSVRCKIEGGFLKHEHYGEEDKR